MRGCERMFRNWRKLLLISALFIAAVACSAQTQAQRPTPQPLGKLVDVGGYRVHLYCTGTGSPTVVITGAGYSFDWGLVQPEVAKFTRVCTYDHSGVAWSDPGPTDTCALRVKEIHSMLRNSSIDEPYVLVGHSLGALVSRLYESEYPDEVAGMVIVDHAAVVWIPSLPPDGKSYFGGSTSRAVNAMAPSIDQTPSTEQLTGSIDFDFRKLPAKDYELHMWGDSLPNHAKIMQRNRAMTSECDSEATTAISNQSNSFGDKPLIILSTPIGQAYASQLISLSSNSRQIVAENSSHYIMIDRPDLVINAIHEVVEAARHHSKLKTKDM
jgi:pimeloyl-ACP methyl ester carboxylesterase